MKLIDKLDRHAKLELAAITAKFGVSVEDGAARDVSMFENRQGVTMQISGGRYSSAAQAIEGMSTGALKSFLDEEVGSYGTAEDRRGSRMLLVDQLLREAGVTDE